MSATEQVTPFVAIVLGFVIGGFGGALNSILKWLELDEPFSSKKNIKAIIVGVVAGLGLTVASVAVLKENLTPDVLLVQLVIIFIGALGFQSATNKIAGIVSGSKQKEEGAPVTTATN